MSTQASHGGGRLLAVALAAVALFAAAPAGAQYACELPLFVKQFGVDANIMFLVDNSGSMNEIVWHPDYDQNTAYTGRFSTNTYYYITRDQSRTPRNFNAAWPATPSAYLVNSDNGEDGRYIGNYLNWVYFHATDAQRAVMPTVTRIQLLKTVVNDIVARSELMRFGITIFHQEGPGNIVGKVSKNKQAIYSIVNGITANAWTPTGEAMETVVEYFQETGSNAPIQAHCQKNFLVAVTDGFPTHDRDVGLGDADHDGLDPGNCASIGAPYTEDNQCSHYMDDVAYYAANTDLRPDLEGDQTLTTYCIGFMVNAPLMAETARDGGGVYYSANTASALVYAFSRVMQDIIKRISSGSAVAVISTERGDDDRMFRGKFMPGTWEGFLEAFAVPYHEGAEPVWEGGNLLAHRSPDSRRIFTAIGDNAFDFTTSYAGTLRDAMALATDDSAAAIIAWTRGEDVAGFRGRGGWRLGDIVSSTPVIVGPPSNFSLDEDYQEFLTTHADRTRMIYIGANDGMMHAFRAEDGQEEWAFVPEFALPKLKAVADSFYCHTYSCDQTASVRDVKIDGDWRTVLCAGGREGGASYFALDVTDPSSPTVMWQVTLPDGHDFASEVEFAVIDDTPVVLIGSGLNATDGRGWVYAYDVAEGTLLGSQALSTVRGGRNKVSRPRAVDTDLDGDTDVIYVAEMAGKVWRFATGGSESPGSWSGSVLYSGTQEISSTPAVAFGEDENMLVFFGTGAYVTEADFATSAQQSFYCVYDGGNGATRTRNLLLDQTDEAQDLGDRPGWYVDLWNGTGERVTEQAVVVAGTVIFTSYAPVMAVCQAGGHSWLYRLTYDEGGALEDEDGNEQPRSEDLGDGIASRPVVDLVNENVVIQSSDASIAVEEIGAAFFHLSVRAWQETYDHAGSAANQ